MRPPFFLEKLFSSIRNAPVAFGFLIVALSGTSIAFFIAKAFLAREDTARFVLLTKELETVITRRINRMVDFPLTVAPLVSSKTTEKEFNDYLKGITIDARYPGVREVGLFTVKNQNQSISDKKSIDVLYRYQIKGQNASLPVDEIPALVNTTTENDAYPLLISIGGGAYALAVPAGLPGDYFYITMDANEILNHLFLENSIFGSLDFRIYDSADTRKPIFDSSGAGDDVYSHAVTTRSDIKIAVIPWQLLAHSDPALLAFHSARHMPLFVLISGLVISLLLFGVLLALSRSRTEARRLAKEMTATLAESEEKYRGIFETLQDVYYRTDAQGILTTISPSISHYLGVPASYLIGHPATDFYVNPQERESMLSELGKKGLIKDYPLSLRGKDGTVIFASLNAHVVVDKNGKPAGIEGLIRDVTDRKKGEDSLRDRSAELERLNKVMIGRELRMVELKKTIDELQIKAKKKHAKK